jgi:hypothetical protein
MSLPAAAAVRAQAEEAPNEEAGDGFRFPDDKGGQTLARALPPADTAPATGESGGSGPKRLPGAAALEQPSVPLAPNQGKVPRLPASRTGLPPRPRPLPEVLPPAGSRPEMPQAPLLPAGDRVRLPGPDVSRPVPLPVLATPAPDRGLDDPTADFSSAAAQAGAVPARQAPAPFIRVSLPDPFENRDAVRLRETPPEKGDPVTAAPKLPGK